MATKQATEQKVGIARFASSVDNGRHRQQHFVMDNEVKIEAARVYFISIHRITELDVTYRGRDEGGALKHHSCSLLLV